MCRIHMHLHLISCVWSLFCSQVLFLGELEEILELTQVGKTSYSSKTCAH